MRNSNNNLLVALSIAIASLLTGTGQVSAQITSVETTTVVQEDGDGVSALIQTGRDRSDTASFWHCEIVDSVQTSLDFRLWRDGTGFVGKRSTDWKLIEDSVLQFDFAEGTTTLSLEEVNAQQLAATTESGEAVTCRFSGQPRGSIDSFLLDGEINDAQQQTVLFSNTSNWTCNMLTAEGNSLATSLTFNVDGTGTTDQSAMTWYIDDNNSLYVSQQDKQDIYNQLYVEASGQPQMHARLEGSTLDCFLGS